MSIKILIADDHSMVREGLKQLLELEGDFQVVSEAANGMEALENIKATKPDILLLDVNMPVMNGLEILAKIKQEKIGVKVLILTIHNEVEYLLKAVEIGCDGYILKDSNSTLLKRAIHAVYNGESYIQPDLIPVLNAGLANKTTVNSKLSELTKREIEVLKLISEGLFNKEIAYNLEISERTVKNHVSNIFKKINVSDRTQAAVFAIKNGFSKYSLTTRNVSRETFLYYL